MIAMGDVTELAKLAGTAVGTGALVRVLQWRSQNRLTEATADATHAGGQADLLEAAATAVGAIVPHLMEQLQRTEARLDAQAAELAAVRGELLRLIGERTEDRVQITEDRAQISTLSSELAHERARNTRTDVYLVALQAWAADAVREIRRLDGTISDPPVPPTDPPIPPVPAPRRPSE